MGKIKSRMLGAKLIVCIITALIIIASSPSTFYSAQQTITKSVEFTSESKNPMYTEFQAELIENGTIYELEDINYEKISEENKTVLEDKTTNITKTGLNSKSYSVGSSETINIDDKTYIGTVTEVRYEDNSKINRTGEVSGSQDYGLRTDRPNPPSSKTLPYYDSVTGQSYNIEAPLTNLETTSTKWQDYTHIDLSFSNYTDTQYSFNGKTIQNDGSTVLSSSYYSELLSMAGLSGSNYRISSIYWTGAPYKEGNLKYRNARADIQAYCCSYKAHYYKKFSLNDVPQYTAYLTFRYEKENVIKTIYKYKATATYVVNEIAEETTERATEAVAEKEATKDTPKFEETVKAVTTLSLILVVSLAFVLIGFFLLTKIKSGNSSLAHVLNKQVSKKRRK